MKKYILLLAVMIVATIGAAAQQRVFGHLIDRAGVNSTFIDGQLTSLAGVGNMRSVEVISSENRGGFQKLLQEVISVAQKLKGSLVLESHEDGDVSYIYAGKCASGADDAENFMIIIDCDDEDFRAVYLCGHLDIGIMMQRYAPYMGQFYIMP